MKSLMPAATAALLVIGGASHAGVMVGARTSATQDPNWKITLLAFEASIGRPLAIDSDYNNWAALPDPPRIAFDLRTGPPAQLPFVARSEQRAIREGNLEVLRELRAYRTRLPPA